MSADHLATQPASPLSEISKGLRGLSGYALRVYLISALTLVVGLGVFAGCYAAFIAMDGSWIRGTASGLVASGAIGVLGLILSVKVTVFYTTARAVKQCALGKNVLHLLLQTDLANHLPDQLDYSEGELRKLLATGGARINQSIKLAAFPRLLRRVVKQGSKLIIRLVTEKVMAAAGEMNGAERRITKDALLRRLSDEIDQRIIEEIRGQTQRFVVGIALFALLMIGLCANGVRLLPGV